MTEFCIRKAEQLFVQAKTLHGVDQPAATLRLLRSCLELAPQHRQAHLLLADVLEQQGNVVEAATALEQAVSRIPNDDELRFRAAVLQLDAGQFSAACGHLQQLHSRYPTDENLLIELALMWRNTRQYPQLLASLDPIGDTKLQQLVDQARAVVEPAAKPTYAYSSMQLQLLYQHGVCMLGTGHDNARDIPHYSTYLITNDDIIETVVRFVSCASQLLWRWPAVIAFSRQAEVLAHLLGHGLGVEVIPHDRVGDFSVSPSNPAPLGVSDLLTPGWETASPAAAQLATHGSLFACGVVDIPNQRRLPTFFGLPCGERVCLPWDRLGEARIGFKPEGLLHPLPRETDTRPPEVIAGDYWPVIRERLAHGPTGPTTHLLQLFSRSHASLHPELRKRAPARLPVWQALPNNRDDTNIVQTLRSGSQVEVTSALRALDRQLGRQRVYPAQALLKGLEAAFHRFLQLRTNIADILFRLAPARFGQFLASYLRQGIDAVAIRERECLVHLFGYNPWSPTPEPLLASWVGEAVQSSDRPLLRSELVQSKYGLLFLWDSGQLDRWLDHLLADIDPVVLGTLQWLHDEPAAHSHAHRAAAVLDHANTDVVHAGLELATVATVQLPLPTLDRMIADATLPERLRCAAVSALTAHPFTVVSERLAALRGQTCLRLRAAAVAALVHYDPVDASQNLAAWFATEEDVCAPELLRALNAAPSFHHLAPVLAAMPRPSQVKALVSACQGTLVGFDDPQLLAHIRRYPACYSLDPCYGFADYLYRHANPASERALVFNALGATDHWSAYQAMAVLARWGDEQMADNLERALDYRADHALAALAGRLGYAGCDELPPYLKRLETHFFDARGWPIVCQLAGDDPRATAVRAWIDGSPARSPTWARFCERQLRKQIPAPYRVGAQSADFWVMEKLLPQAFATMHRRVLYGVPDRFAVDLLMYLGTTNPELGRTYARLHVNSQHFGMRLTARLLNHA